MMHMLMCPHCFSFNTYKYHLGMHGYGCTDCGKDFGRVIRLPKVVEKLCGYKEFGEQGGVTFRCANPTGCNLH